MVESTLASWARSDDRDKKILEDLKFLSKSHKLGEILGRILMFLGKLDKDIVKPLLRSVSRNIESVPMEGDRSEQDIQFKLILFLLSERVPNEEQQATTEAVIRDIRPINVAVRVVNALSSDQSAVTWGLRRSLDVPRLEKIVQDRFVREFVDTGVDVFLANDLPQYVLYQIGTYNPESAQMINEYALKLLENESKYIGKLIDGFLIEFPGGPHGFNFDQLKSVYDINRLSILARQAGVHGWANDKEKRAIEKFLSLAENEGRDAAPTQS
jgi:hypothetical protein